MTLKQFSFKVIHIPLFLIIITIGYAFINIKDNQIHLRTQTQINQINSTHYSCDNNTKILLLSTLNDDYCDCNDGSDENKTNACPNGQFKCTNKLYYSKVISTSKLNDGYCDCCDGSDEDQLLSGSYTQSKCNNTCLIYSNQLYQQLTNDFTMLTQVINSYSTEQNEAFFSYIRNELLNLQSAYKRYYDLLKKKHLISSYIYYTSSKMTNDNEDFTDENGIRLSSAVNTLGDLNSKLKLYDEYFNNNMHVLNVYSKYGLFKDLNDECIDLNYNYYTCHLCFKSFMCKGETKDGRQKANHFGDFTGFKGNVAHFENGNYCGNYDIQLSAEITFECDFKEGEFKFVEKVNKCLYRFVYYTKLGCNSYKLNNIINDIQVILN